MGSFHLFLWFIPKAVCGSSPEAEAVICGVVGGLNQFVLFGETDLSPLSKMFL